MMKVTRARDSFEMELIAKTPLPARRTFLTPVHFPEITTPNAKQRLLGEKAQRFHGKFNSINHFVNHRALPLENMSFSSKKSFATSKDKVHPKISDEDTNSFTLFPKQGNDQHEIFLSNGSKFIYKSSYREAAIACYRKHNLLQRVSHIPTSDMSAKQPVVRKKLRRTLAHSKKSDCSHSNVMTSLHNPVKTQITDGNAFPESQLPGDSTHVTGNSKNLDNADDTCENSGETRMSFMGESTYFSSSIVSSIYLKTFNTPEPPPNSQNSDTITIVSENEDVEVIKDVSKPEKLTRKLKKLRSLKELCSKGNRGEQSTRKNDWENKRETENNFVLYPRQPTLVKKTVTFHLSQDSPNRNVLNSKTRTLFPQERISAERIGMKIHRYSCPSAKFKSPANTSDFRPCDRFVQSDAAGSWKRPIFEVPDGNLDALSMKTFLISKMKTTPGYSPQKDDPLLLGHLDVHGRDRLKWTNPPSLYKIGIIGPDVSERKKGWRKSFGGLIPSTPKDQNVDFTKNKYCSVIVK